ncbi:hypothetical protein LY13_003584 [Prauserella aidingensis]|uniref:hypothetical protein n=1 Tax=Prauserella aidingensis TaxID=387890 RepID=UPI0020A246D6|nr:hypothetical protein [Prauserella aidingensis]MCP2254814.1 hypothetical protein [Prauserella aidingensis]
MAATTPTPDARRVRRWLSRALAVSGGAAAATAIAWAVGTTSASATENPLDVGADNPAASVPVASGSASQFSNAESSESDESHLDIPQSDAWQAGDRQAGRSQSTGGADQHGGTVQESTSSDGATSSGGSAAEWPTDGEHGSGAETCGESADGPTDVRGLFDRAHGTRFDLGRFHTSDRDPADSETCPNEAERPDGTDEQADEHGVTEHDATSVVAGGSGDTRKRVEQAWQRHVAEPTREAIHRVGDTVRAVTSFDGWSGGSPSWSGFDLPWTGLTPDADDLPSPYDVPMGPDVHAHAPETPPHNADAREAGDRRQPADKSTSDYGVTETSGVLDTGFDGAGTDGAAVGPDSGEPTMPSLPEFAPQYVPASVPSHSTIAGGAHADAPSGAVVTTADPFAVAAVGAVTRSGSLNKSMSPGSQPGVTPD